MINRHFSRTLITKLNDFSTDICNFSTERRYINLFDTQCLIFEIDKCQLSRGCLCKRDMFLFAIFSMERRLGEAHRCISFLDTRLSNILKKKVKNFPGFLQEKLVLSLPFFTTHHLGGIRWHGRTDRLLAILYILHLRLGLAMCLFTSIFRPLFYIHFSSSLAHLVLDFIILTIFGEELQIIQLIIMKFSPSSYYFIVSCVYMFYSTLWSRTPSKWNVYLPCLTY
jgi:hypothetical protein